MAFLKGNVRLNPAGPNSDQRDFSPYHFGAL